MIFGRKNKDEPKQDIPQTPPSSVDPRQVFKDTILAFAYPWNIPEDIRNLHPAYMGMDAATSDLSDREIQAMRLRMSAFNDLLLATMFRPCEIDRNGVQILSRNMQAEDLGYIRLKKSRNGKLLQLAVSVHQIHEHRYSNDENGMRRVL